MIIDFTDDFKRSSKPFKRSSNCREPSPSPTTRQSEKDKENQHDNNNNNNYESILPPPEKIYKNTNNAITKEKENKYPQLTLSLSLAYASAFSEEEDKDNYIFERERAPVTTNETTILLDENIKLKNHLTNMEAELNNSSRTLSQCLKSREDLQTSNNGLEQELKSANKRIAAFQAEQIQAKRQWASEKTELESRYFQALSLLTQTQGTLRKREKDLEKLQSSLEKMATKEAKANKFAFTISKPLPKAFSQQQQSAATSSSSALKDVEVEVQRQLAADYRREVSSLCVQLDEAIKSEENMKNKYESVISHLNTRIDCIHRQMLMAFSNQREQRDVLTDSQSSTSTVGSSTQSLQMAASEEETSLPADAEASTLQQRAVLIMRKADAISAQLLVATSGTDTIRDEDETSLLRDKLQSVMHLLEQQDALLHEAIFGTLPHSPTDIEDEAMEMQGDSPHTCTHAPSIFSPTQAFAFSLLPASPATYAVLKACGWGEEGLLPTISSNI